MSLENLFVFVVLHHGLCRILHVNVTAHPTAEWTAQQLVEALGDEDAPEATYLIRDRDGIYSDVFQRKVTALNLDDVITPKASRWCNAFAERLVRSIKEECLGRMIFFGESSLLRAIQEYVAHFHFERAHQGLGNKVIERARPRPTLGTEVRCEERLGGLLKHYTHAA